MRNLFTKKWFITLIGVIALSILIWFVGPLIAIAGTTFLASVTSRLTVIAILFLIWIISNLNISLKKRQEINEFSNDLKENADASIVSESKKSDSNKNELSMLKMHFNETLKTLKETQWGGKSGLRNLYEQPWYVIIGAPGSGKTTALINSGLTFPLAKPTGKETVSGIGGTRFCEWLITDEAVLIDTAGRYTTQDSNAAVDASGWHDFLSLLKKQKKQRALNGILITVSMQDILQQNTDEKKFQINSIQKRLQELNTQLGVQMPVYFILTKCDLIHGFEEFFSEMSQEERKQVWGMTFPEETIYDNELQIKTAFLPEYDNLIARVNQRVISRLDEERQDPLKGQILGFPQQMAIVRAPLNEFIVSLFSSTRFYQRIMLRGVYFTSGAQQGEPIDQVKDYFSNTFGLENQSKPHKADNEYSFFLYNLLKEVIFKESGLAGGNVKLEKKFLWLKIASFTGIALMSLLAISLWSISFFANDSRVTQAQKYMSAFYQELTPLKANEDHYKEKETLAALKDIYQASRVYGIDQEDIPFNIQYGLYQGDTLTPLNDAYLNQLNELFIPSISRRLIQQMNNNLDNSELLYQSLKAYLMLGLPERMDKEFVQHWMLFDWQQRYKDKEILRDLNTHLDNALSHLESIRLNDIQIKKVRSILLKIPLPKQIYMNIKQEAKGLGEDYSYEKNVGAYLVNIFTGADKSIPWLYTKEGYQDYFQKNTMTAIKDFLQEDWVLNTRYGELNSTNFKKFYNEVEALYMNDYIRYWDSALLNVKVKEINSFNDFIKLLEISSSEQLPFKKVLADTKENTSLEGFSLKSLSSLPNMPEIPDIPDIKGVEDILDILPSGISSKAYRLKNIIDTGNKVSTMNSSDKTAKKVKKSTIENHVVRHFKPIHQVFQSDEVSNALITQVQAELTELLNLVNRIKRSEDPNEAIFIQVKKYLQGQGFHGKLRTLADRSPEPLKSWLNELSMNIWSVAFKDTHHYINEKYKADVYSFYLERLHHRYPLFKQQKDEITLSDFATFFKPKGIEDQFFIDYIKPFIYINGDHWKERSVNGIQVGFSPEYITQLQRASLIRKVIFKGGPKPDINFSIKLNSASRYVKKFGFQVGDKKDLFSKKALFNEQNYHWPSQQRRDLVAVFVLLKNKGQIKNRDQIGIGKTGPWSLFRLLDVLDVEPIVGSNTLIIKAKFKKHRAQFQLKPNTNGRMNPFNENLLKTYRCMDHI